MNAPVLPSFPLIASEKSIKDSKNEVKITNVIFKIVLDFLLIPVLAST